MKKLFLVMVMVGSLVSGAFAGVENCSTGNNLLQPTNFYKASGYTLQYKEDGVCLYKKDGSDVYAQIIDLAGGANISFGISDYVKTDTLNNGQKAKLYKKKSIIEHFYDSYGNSSFFSVINAQFFGNFNGNTFLSFPTKLNNQIISEESDMRGWSSDTFRTLNIFTKSSSWSGVKSLANAYPYYNKNQYDGLNEKVIVGGNPFIMDKGMYSNSSRTFISPIGSYSNGGYPLLVIITSKKKVTQPYMITELKKWGAIDQNIIMFDGGGSTQMMDVKGLEVYGISSNASKPDERTIPMVFRVYTHK